MIVDNQGRRFRNLRVSMTAACNYACTYCVPDGKRLLPARHELSAQQMLYAVDLMIETAGIEKLRITGGEPLVSPKFDSFFPEVMKLPLDDVSITTNGQLIPRKADLLVNAGLKRINISLDTLDPDAFRQIARGGDLKTVLHGIDLMGQAGIRIKVNMVPMRRSNADQVLPLLDYCLERGIELRFIELMNMGHLRQGNQYLLDFYSMDELLQTIGTRYQYAQTDAPFDATAVRYQIPGKGTFGIIANESQPFCATCTRLRLASNGKIYGCLSNSAFRDMKPILEMPRHLAVQSLQRMLLGALGDKQNLSFRGEVTVMKFIGG
ncbi:MAG: GTP 3',8-cyclase MoaA [Proteobacteria bacterium]|nr:GTP 3',8-cyclase MoaA [Pseudomonadota bacterium]